MEETQSQNGKRLEGDLHDEVVLPVAVERRADINKKRKKENRNAGGESKGEARYERPARALEGVL